MNIYLDFVYLINFSFDFILLISLSLLLKRNVKIYKLLFGSFIGSITIFLLFFNISSYELFIIKFLISVLMILITFGYKRFKYFIENLFYLYIVSSVLGGTIYMINNNFSYKQNGLIFYYNGISFNIIFILLISPILLYIYIKKIKNYKADYSDYYKVKIYLDKNKKLELNAFLDTGNRLIDPITHKPVILINKKRLIYDINEFKMILVPYKTIDNESIIRCIIVDRIEIDGIGIRKKILLGIMEDNINLNNIDCILNNYIMEG